MAADRIRPSRAFTFASLLVLAAPFAVGCSVAADEGGDGAEGESTDAIVDVPHTAVERQSIGNCWLYAHATWVESMNKTATGQDLDVSQSYWTYWHWFDQITGVSGWGVLSGKEIQTGGTWQVANNIVRRYGIMKEADFVPADAENEMSSRQASALATMNTELATGRLKERSARSDKALVRKVLDEAWQLKPEVVANLDRAFGTAVTKAFTPARGQQTAVATGTPILRAQDVKAAYAVRNTRSGAITNATKTVREAQNEWKEISYAWESDARGYQIKVQRALHARQPVIITWDVDFNAMENGTNDLRGSFNMTTLNRLYAQEGAWGGPGRQGGHMTVLEDYEIKTVDYGTLKAGTTLDPNVAADKAKLDAALLPTSEIVFFRVKNSWGSSRMDRAFAPGMPGYHDLYMDYLNGPIKWCSKSDDVANDEGRGCDSTSKPLDNMVVPPGFDR